MKFIKGFLLFLLCSFATIGQGGDDKKQTEAALSYFSGLIEEKYQLSTTGYQTATTKKGIFMTL